MSNDDPTEQTPEIYGIGKAVWEIDYGNGQICEYTIQANGVVTSSDPSHSEGQLIEEDPSGIWTLSGVHSASKCERIWKKREQLIEVIQYESQQNMIDENENGASRGYGIKIRDL